MNLNKRINILHKPIMELYSLKLYLLLMLTDRI